MEQKLTAQIAHAYLGAKVQKNYAYLQIITPLGIGENGYYYPNQEGQWVDFDSCQPILTRLSNITNEDALEVAKIVYTPGSSFITAGFGRAIINGEWDITFNIDIANQITDFLRASSWNEVEKPVYDCGYGSIPSLIDAGIAISSDTKK